MTQLQPASVGEWGVPIFTIEGASESLDRLGELLAELSA